jgi:hypothetical protein
MPWMLDEVTAGQAYALGVLVVANGMQYESREAGE